MTQNKRRAEIQKFDHSLALSQKIPKWVQITHTRICIKFVEADQQNSKR